MKSNLMHLVFLLDRSGSMGGCWTETVNGLKVLLEEQKKVAGELTVSLYSFDSSVERHLDFVNVKDIKGDFLEGISPRAMTALYEATCKSIDEVGKKLSDTPEALRPEKIVFVVLTDGGENASNKDFSLSKVKEKIEHQTKVYNWEFMFVGASFDAREITTSVGLDHSHAYNYDKSHTTDNFTKFSRDMVSYRGLKSAKFKDIVNEQ